jgi:uncharacterized protein (TIGR02001 family)
MLFVKIDLKLLCSGFFGTNTDRLVASGDQLKPNQPTPMIKSALVSVLALGATASVFGQAAATASSAVEFTLDNTVVTEYVFRGQQYGDLTYHPSVKAAYGDFYASVWAAMGDNLSLGDYEIDYAVGYTLAINDTFSLDVGGTFFTYTGTVGNTDTIEPYAGVQADLGGVGLGFYYYYDLQIDDSTYEVEATYSFPVDAIKTSLDFSATVGFVSGDLAENVVIADNYTYYGAALALPFQVSDNATLTVGISYTDVSEDAINDSSETVYSAGLAVRF